MCYYINTLVLDVVEDDYKVKPDPKEWIEYPYDEHNPERYSLYTPKGDPIWGTEINNLFALDKSMGDSIEELNCFRRRLIEQFPQYDYICCVVEEYLDDSECYSLEMFKPYGCYKPSAERALKWYQEQQEDVERQREKSKKNLEHTIKDLTKRLKEAEIAYCKLI